MDNNGSGHRLSESGVVSPLLVSTIILGIFLLCACGAFIWAYSGMTEWQKNGQAKIDRAVTQAKEMQTKQDNADFMQREKTPNRHYQGPAETGSVRFDYPKTWSGYVAGSTNNSLSLYFFPIMIPAVNPGVTPYALRVLVVPRDYSQVLLEFKSLVDKGMMKASPITIGAREGFAGYNGMRFDGQLTPTINGSVVVFKVRDKTLKLYVDSKDFRKDFDETILRTLQFQP